MQWMQVGKHKLGAWIFFEGCCKLVKNMNRRMASRREIVPNGECVAEARDEQSNRCHSQKGKRDWI